MRVVLLQPLYHWGTHASPIRNSIENCTIPESTEGSIHNWKLRVEKFLQPFVRHSTFRNWWEKVDFGEYEVCTRAEGKSYKQIRQNRSFTLVANDTFYNKGEKRVFCSPFKGGKVHFSNLRCENIIFSRLRWNGPIPCVQCERETTYFE